MIVLGCQNNDNNNNNGDGQIVLLIFVRREGEEKVDERGVFIITS